LKVALTASRGSGPSKKNTTSVSDKKDPLSVERRTHVLVERVLREEFLRSLATVRFQVRHEDKTVHDGKRTATLAALS
jgi:hypothetical protein